MLINRFGIAPRLGAARTPQMFGAEGIPPFASSAPQFALILRGGFGGLARGGRGMLDPSIQGIKRLETLGPHGRRSCR